MKCYFHCDANIYRKRVRTFLEYVAVPGAVIAVFLTVCLLLSFRSVMHSGLLLPAAATICAVIFVFTLVTRIMIEVTERRVSVHSKYTYVEVGLKDAIVSLYAGSYTRFGKRTVLRRMIVVPLGKLESAEVVGNGRIRFRTSPPSIREYLGNTDRLGYYFRDGTLCFKEFFYEEQGFSTAEQAVIPRRFEDAEEIVESVLYAKERCGGLSAAKSAPPKETPKGMSKISPSVKRHGMRENPRFPKKY